MKKHIRIQVDFTIEVDEAHIQFSPNMQWVNVPSGNVQRNYLNRQRNLFRALLSQPELLHRYLEYLAFVEVATADGRNWVSALGIDDSDFDDIILSAVTNLKPSDQKWFTKSAENEVLFDNTEEFQKGFAIAWGDAKLIEVAQDSMGDCYE